MKTGEVLHVSIVKKKDYSKHATLYSSKFPLSDTNKLISFFLILRKYGVDLEKMIDSTKDEI